jgi:hypothetical protein
MGENNSHPRHENESDQCISPSIKHSKSVKLNAGFSQISSPPSVMMLTENSTILNPPHILKE